MQSPDALLIAQIAHVLAELAVKQGICFLFVGNQERQVKHAKGWLDGDDAFLADLPPNVDACGENGEFHTFVYDGPNFDSAVPFALTRFEPYVAPIEFGGTRYCFASLE